MIRLALLLLFVLFIVHVVENKGFQITLDVDGKPAKYGFRLDNKDAEKKP